MAIVKKILGYITIHRRPKDGEKGEPGRDGTNYLIMGWWDPTISYKLSDAGIPVVKVADTSPNAFSVYKLINPSSTIGAKPPNNEWELVESAEFIYMQDAYIQRLQFESARGGGFEIENRQFVSIKKALSGDSFIAFDGNNGAGHIAGRNIWWNEFGWLFANKIIQEMTHLQTNGYIEDYISDPNASETILVQAAGPTIGLATSGYLDTPTAATVGRKVSIYNNGTPRQCDAPIYGKMFFKNSANLDTNSIPDGTSGIITRFDLRAGIGIELLCVPYTHSSGSTTEYVWWIKDIFYCPSSVTT